MHARQTRYQSLAASDRCSAATVEGDPARHENIRVPGSHIGLGFNPVVLWIVADRLAQPEGAWRCFEPSGVLGQAYRLLTHERLPV